LFDNQSEKILRELPLVGSQIFLTVCPKFVSEIKKNRSFDLFSIAKTCGFTKSAVLPKAR